MNEYICDVAVVGAGPAGLAAAVSAKKNGAKKVMIIERDVRAGGILQQCIHAGFGLKYFGRELTGPEYAELFQNKAEECGVELLLDTMAMEIRESENLLVCSNKTGLTYVRYNALVLAMGCRERTRANLMIPGSRPSGIYTAGTAQKLVNIYGHNIGKEVVILGSGDIGMIMARRMSIEGAHVKAVIELMPFLAGLKRNKVQCLDDFGIPLLLSHTIVDITGIDRLESVTIAPVDENKQPKMEKSQVIPCDTLLLSVGLIPENELSRTGGVALSGITKGAVVNQFKQTENPAIFACGNVLHVNDLVDHVSQESEAAGKYAAMYAAGTLPGAEALDTKAGSGVRYVCPQKIVPVDEEDAVLFFRTVAPGRKTKLTVSDENGIIAERMVLATSPGTMESLVIPANKVSALKGTVTVTAEHQEVLA